MSRDPAEAVARAVLYEGYLLYPYRASSLKNRHRLSPGGLYPAGWAGGEEPSALGCECLLEAPPAAEVELRVRFLHLFEGDQPGCAEAAEREVAAPLRLEAGSVEREGRCPAEARPGRSQAAVQVGLRATATLLEGGLYRLALRVENRTPLAPGASRLEAQRRALASAHALLRVRGGRFVSLLEPEERYRAAAAGCRQAGAWPVLVGPPGSADAMLAAPIILYDHPAVAPESPGDLFDATEIDEILTLRILTLSEREKAELRAAGGPARALLERTEALSEEELLALHGARRGREGEGP